MITQTKTDKIKNFGYQILDTLSIEDGIKIIETIPKKKTFSRKHILAELLKTNNKCVCCGKETTKICLGKKISDDSLHWDAYSIDDYSFSIDHNIPRHNGGKNHISNIQLMCTKCNSFKSSYPERTFVYITILKSNANVLSINGSDIQQNAYIITSEKVNEIVFDKIKEYVEEICEENYFIYKFKKIINGKNQRNRNERKNNT